MIEYRKGSLFNSPPGAYMAHACNAQGVWGRGIATEFKVAYPKSFEQYREFCRGPSVGRTLITTDKVICLITSRGYGKNTEDQHTILKHTRSALESLMRQLPGATHIHSNKFNSGLFGVEWRNTENLIEQIVPANITWTVWVND